MAGLLACNDFFTLDMVYFSFVNEIILFTLNKFFNNSHVLLFFRTVLLHTSAYDTRQKFLISLHKAFGGGTFSLGPYIGQSQLATFLDFLKGDYHSRQSVDFVDFFQAENYGYQGQCYWLLSEKVFFLH